MKSLLSLFILSTSTLFAGIIPDKSLPLSSHKIVKEYPQDDLEPGTCKILGHVYYGHSKDNPLENVLVSALDKENFDHTDSKGYYEFIMNTEDTSLFAFKSQLSEHVIWNELFKSRYVYEIDFYLVDDYENMIMDKPVIYLYSNERQDVDIEIVPNGEFTFTYPKYNDSWQVNVSNNVLTCENRTYPYLFWEATTNNLDYDKNERVYGKLIKTVQALAYLESSLTTLGLNYQEKADFITYWMPRIQQKEYAFIQFMIDEDYESNISSMTVSPAPNSMRRIFMLFTLYDKKPIHGNYEEQELPSFERKGFTLIEWGGSQKRNCQAFIYETADL